MFFTFLSFLSFSPFCLSLLFVFLCVHCLSVWLPVCLLSLSPSHSLILIVTLYLSPIIPKTTETTNQNTQTQRMDFEQLSILHRNECKFCPFCPSMGKHSVFSTLAIRFKEMLFSKKSGKNAHISVSPILTRLPAVLRGSWWSFFSRSSLFLYISLSFYFYIYIYICMPLDRFAAYIFAVFWFGSLSQSSCALTELRWSFCLVLVLSHHPQSSPSSQCLCWFWLCVQGVGFRWGSGVLFRRKDSGSFHSCVWRRSLSITPQSLFLCLSTLRLSYKVLRVM